MKAGYVDTDSDGGLEDDLARRRGRGVGRGTNGA